jgi:hypothetical protein
MSYFLAINASLECIISVLGKLTKELQICTIMIEDKIFICLISYGLWLNHSPQRRQKLKVILSSLESPEMEKVCDVVVSVLDVSRGKIGNSKVGNGNGFTSCPVVSSILEI